MNVIYIPPPYDDYDKKIFDIYNKKLYGKYSTIIIMNDYIEIENFHNKYILGKDILCCVFSKKKILDKCEFLGDNKKINYWIMTNNDNNFIFYFTKKDIYNVAQFTGAIIVNDIDVVYKYNYDHRKRIKKFPENACKIYKITNIFSQKKNMYVFPDYTFIDSIQKCKSCFPNFRNCKFGEIQIPIKYARELLNLDIGLYKYMYENGPIVKCMEDVINNKELYKYFLPPKGKKDKIESIIQKKISKNKKSKNDIDKLKNKYGFV